MKRTLSSKLAITLTILFLQLQPLAFAATATNAATTAVATAATNPFQSEKDIITREQWGSDESYLFLESNDTIPDLIQLDEDFVNKYSDELEISRTVTHDPKGRAFKWPPAYAEETTKFIVHHTETTSNLDDSPQAIRSIYKYHAINRGWGDIGYNYIIDQQGRVYEGRYGGEGVVGGHAGPGNIGSIGIAILGSYDDDDVPEAAIESLARLIAIKSKIHDIDPAGYSFFRGDLMPNVIAHRDVMNTDCPGDYLYDKLPLIQSMAASMKDNDKPKFVNDYDYIDESDVYYLEMDPYETETVTIKLENIGKVTWNSETYLTANNDPAHKGVISFPNKSGISLATMKEKKVEPGDTATFTFTVKSSKKGALIYLDLAPVINGEKKISDYKVLPIKTNAPVYTYDIKAFDTLPATMKKNETFEGTIKLKNTSNTTWSNSGQNKVVIKNGPLAIGVLKEDKVSAGGTGTFEIKFKAPATQGHFEGEFDVVMQGGRNLSGEKLEYSTVITKEGYFGEITRQTTSDIEFKQGSSYVVWVELRNVGSKTWNSEDMNLVSFKDKNVTVKERSITKTKVAPGGLVKVEFIIEINEDAVPGTKGRFTMMPKIGNRLLGGKKIYVDFTVAESLTVKEEIKQNRQKVYAVDPSLEVKNSDLTEEEGGNFRVRISFFESPIITSTVPFYLYNSKGEKLKTIKAGESVQLGIVGTKYKAKLSTESKLVLDENPFSVRASEGGVLEITNFSRPSSWNPDYNDNSFRGAIEMQMVDGQYAVINELPLENYLKGLAEEPNSEEYEKIKAIMVAARSYAKFYMHYAEKFPGKPYHLNDDPAQCQKYLGYGYESRASNIVKAVEDTEGEVVTHYGQLVKTPYFSSDSGKTKSALEVWSWNAPYLVSVDDPYCEGSAQSGHGVGMSGCGARGMAQAGYNYKAILKYYYTDTAVTKLY